MEDLYCDLENYQYDNIVSELKNENQELKSKLEDYASTLASLQKDFDKLSAEYKKLELNYSSLLKTARAEIERKSQMITNLNIEKDKLVIEAIQKTGRVQNRYKNYTENKKQIEKQVSQEGASAIENSTVPDTTDNNASGTLNREKKDKHDKTTYSPGPSLTDDSDVKRKDQIFKKDKEKNKNEIKKSKEDISNAFNIDETTSNDKTTFSLDTNLKDNPDIRENEQKSTKLNYHRNKEKNKNEIRKSKENHSDVLSNSAVTSVVNKIRSRRKSMPLVNRGDYKFSSDEDQDDYFKDHRSRRKPPVKDDRIHYDQYREYYGRNDFVRKVPDHIRVGDKYTSNYDSSRDVYRKSNSWYRESDRYKCRDNRDKYESYQRSRRYYSPDRPYNIQGEYNSKYREANDRPYRFDNVRHRTLVSPPPERENQYRRFGEFDGQRFQHEMVYPMKHKLHDVIEEPACKRLKSELLNKPSDKHLIINDRDIEERASSMSRPLELSYFSLQSPDYVHFENHTPVHQIKEIKGTSETKLDDPRLKSKKYIVYSHNDKVELSTVVGRDVNIKTINTSIWDIKKDKKVHKMPTPLREKPPIGEDLVKEIYMDIGNPISHLSLDSGECSEEDMGNLGENKGIVTINTEYSTNNKNVLSNIQTHDQIKANKNEPTHIIDTVQKSCPSLFWQNNSIPKIKKSNTPELLEEDNSHSDKIKRDNIKQSHGKKYNNEKREVHEKLQPDANTCNKNSDTMDACNEITHTLLDIHHRACSPEKPAISARDTVEGDLELSDETCDYIEISEQTKYDKGSKAQNLDEINSDDVSIDKDSNIQERVEFKRENEMSRENKNFDILDKDHEVLNKKSSNKVYKEQKSKDIKSKLCDLFGDTSSLITLDDLGIVGPTTTKENLNEYAPLFDNTQDAVDLNIEEMEKVQTGSMNINRVEIELSTNDAIKEITSKKSEKANKNSTIRENRKFNNNVDKSSSIQHMFENVTKEPDDDVVKTVIISTGIQNNCHSGSTVPGKEREKEIATLQNKTSDNATSCPALLNIKALATSTPCKPQNEPSLLASEISCKSNNSTMKKDASNTSENVCKITNLDIPDVRIIVKRRRKAKGAPS